MDSIPFPDPPPPTVSLRAQMIALLPELRGFARFLVRDRAEADDLVQDAVVRALAALDQFQPGTNLKSWLFTILRNVFFEQARRRRTERAALEHAGVGNESHVSGHEDRGLSRLELGGEALIRDISKERLADCGDAHRRNV